MSVGLRDFVHIIMSLSILIMVENHIEFSRVSFSIHYLPKVHSKLRSLHNNTLNIQGKGFVHGDMYFYTDSSHNIPLITNMIPKLMLELLLTSKKIKRHQIMSLLRNGSHEKTI